MTEGYNINDLLLQPGIQQPHWLGQGLLEKFLLAYKHPEPEKTVGLVVFGNVVGKEEVEKATVIAWYKPNLHADVKVMPGSIVNNKDHLLKYCSDPTAPADAVVYIDDIAKEDLQKMIVMGQLIANIYLSFRGLETIMSESTATQQPKGPILYVARTMGQATGGQGPGGPRQGNR